MYEASGCASVTSASSAVSVPAASICASCKPTPLCSDGCGAAVHGTRGSCGQCTVGTCATEALDRRIGHGHTDNSVRAGTLRARMRACVHSCLLLERWQHATCDGQCNMHRATCNGRHPYSGHAVCGR
jgi:hypothetical protein